VEDAPWRQAANVDTASLLRELSSLGGFNDNEPTAATPQRPSKAATAAAAGKQDKKKKGRFGR
ncbi:MAG: hypothetical protein WAN48_15575, partial [Actinomycetes bacterium]